MTFNEITKKVVSESIKEPRAIDQDLVDAQQARRVLDRLVGFKLSPESLKELSRTSEQYTLAHLEHGLKSLDFLKTVLE